jgi:hypothetical protein
VESAAGPAIASAWVEADAYDPDARDTALRARERQRQE